MTAQMLFLSALLAAGAAAQQPAPQVTVEGCVATEAEIPGRSPDIAERAGLNLDFVLTNAKVIRGAAPAVSADTSGGIVSAALRPMYAIGGLTDEQLKLHVGRRVRIEGRFDTRDRQTPSDEKNDDLVELNAATIRQVPGDCSVPRS
jgi:hypothetical protein